MENKLLLQDMADLLARHDGISRKQAETFVRTFFDIIQEGLESDQLVKIKGFGTFKLVEVSERESVNINTGERFQIGGHTKVSFTPDNSLKELVNRPFAHFQTITLNEETDLEELESVENEIIEEPTPERASAIQAEGNDQRPEEPSDPIRIEPQNVSEATPTLMERDIAAEPKEELHVDESSVAGGNPGIVEEPVIPSSASEVQDVPASLRSQPLGDAEQTQNEQGLEKPAASLLAEAETIPGVDQEQAESAFTETEDTGIDESIDEPIGEPQVAPAGQNALGAEEVKYIVSEGTLRRYRRWKIIALSLFVLILMLLSYFAGYFKMFCPCEWITPEKSAATRQTTQIITKPQKKTSPKQAEMSVTGSQADVPDAPDALSGSGKAVIPSPATSEPVPTSATASSTVQPKAKPKEASQPEGKKLAQVPGGKYVITGTRQSYRVDRGETLRSIAEHIYGSKGYVNYIIVHNHISSPDNVAAGTIIQLPELELRE